jgi:hypothetical protein
MARTIGLKQHGSALWVGTRGPHVIEIDAEEQAAAVEALRLASMDDVDELGDQARLAKLLATGVHVRHEVAKMLRANSRLASKQRAQKRWPTILLVVGQAILLLAAAAVFWETFRRARPSLLEVVPLTAGEPPDPREGRGRVERRRPLEPTANRVQTQSGQP